MTRFATHFDVVDGLGLKTLATRSYVRCHASEPLFHHLDMQTKLDPDGDMLTPCIKASETIQDYYIHFETAYHNRGNAAEIFAFEDKGRRVRLVVFHDGTAAIEWVRIGVEGFNLIPWLFALPTEFSYERQSFPITCLIGIVEIAYDFDRKDAHGAARRGSAHLFAEVPLEHSAIAPVRAAYLSALKAEISKIIDAFQGALPVARGRDALALAEQGLAAFPLFATQTSKDGEAAANRFLRDLAIWFRRSRPEWGKVTITIMGRRIETDGSLSLPAVIFASDIEGRLKKAEALVFDALCSDAPPIPLVAQISSTENQSNPLGHFGVGEYPSDVSSHEYLGVLSRIDPILDHLPVGAI